MKLSIDLKKFIFSAIAMIAFLGSSMASNDFEKTTIFLENDCLNVYGAVSIFAKNQGASEEQADRIAKIARQACWDSMGGKTKSNIN